MIKSGGFLVSLLSKLAGPLMKVAVQLAKKYFSSIKNNSCCFSNCSINSKENKYFWNSNSNSSK